MENYSCLKIGDWKLSLKNMYNSECELYFPLHIGAFSERSKCIESDFKLEIVNRESSDKFTDMIVTKVEEGSRPYWIYKTQSGNYLWNIKNNKQESLVTYSISYDWKEFSVNIHDDKNGLIAFNNFGNVFAYSILNYGGIMFHGIVMEYNGKGVVISASSGTGKTTHVRMWRDNKNALILNGDRALCRKRSNKWYAYGSPWFGTSGECINRRVPMTAIVLLERGEANEIERISSYDGALALIPRTFAPTWEKELMGKALDTIDDIVKEIPVLRLKCRPDLESVEVLEKAINNL